MRHTKLVHGVEGLPGLAVDVEEVDFSVSVRVLATNQDDLSRRDCQSTACPKRILYARNV